MSNYTTQHLKALEDALASGAKSVTYNGETIVYRDMNELRTAITTVRHAIEKQAGGSRPSRQVRFSSRGGNY